LLFIHSRQFLPFDQRRVRKASDVVTSDQHFVNASMKRGRNLSDMLAIINNKTGQRKVKAYGKARLVKRGTINISKI